MDDNHNQLATKVKWIHTNLKINHNQLATKVEEMHNNLQRISEFVEKLLPNQT